MLSEKLKRVLISGAKRIIDVYGIEHCQQAGPEVFIDGAINGSRHAQIRRELQENRDEAIKLTGAIFGYM